MNTEINLPLIWQESCELPYDGQYFIAVRYPNGFGTYDIANWDGRSWNLGYSAEVVGWVTMNDFWSVLKAGWPAGDNKFSEEFEKFYEANKKQNQQSSRDDDFVLVE